MAKKPAAILEDNDKDGVAEITAVADRGLGRAGVHSRRYVKVVVRARQAVPQAGHVERRAVQIGFAVDRSGSMSGPKLALAKVAIAEALQQMLIKDSFAISWFDGHAFLMEPCQRATASAVATTIAAVRQVQTGGDTALHDGWALAADAVRKGREPDAVARVLLLTDGQANRGPSKPLQLGSLAARMRAEGVATSAIGIGDDFNEELLTKMATEGGGNFYYAKTPEDLKRFAEIELGEAKEVVASAVALHIRPSDGVRVDVLSEFPATWTGTELKVNVGDLVSDQEIALVLRLTLPAGQVGERCSLEVTATEAGQVVMLPAQTVGFVLADNLANDAQPRNRGVDRMVAGLYAALARMEAVGHNRRHEFAVAAHLLQQAAARIESYAGDDVPLQQLVSLLRQDAARFAVRQDEMTRKEMYFGSSSLSRGKHRDGTSVRSGDRDLQ